MAYALISWGDIPENWKIKTPLDSKIFFQLFKAVYLSFFHFSFLQWLCLNIHVF